MTSSVRAHRFRWHKPGFGLSTTSRITRRCLACRQRRPYYYCAIVQSSEEHGVWRSDVVTTASPAVARHRHAREV